MKFEYTTPEKNIAELRRRFKDANGLQGARMARWIFNNLTVAQVKNAFNLSDEQVVVLRNRLRDLRDRLDALEAEAGE